MDLISVIVPVYNVAAYLPQCLDSILGQTYRELEIICVNDGSKDRSLELLERYAHKDNRVKVLDKANEGVSRARNDALVVAQGEYVMFVDADDWIDSETCQLAIDAINTHQADVVLWSYVSENKGSQSFKKLFDGDAVFDEDDSRMRLHRRFIGIIGEELTHPELADSLGPVWGKLYKRNVIQQSGAKFVDLSEIGTYEDGLFNLSVEFPDNYPFKHPEVKFITPMYHPNIKKDTGEICMDVFASSWSPTQKVQDILQKLVTLLRTPSTSSPLESEICQEYVSNYSKFCKTAKA